MKRLKLAAAAAATCAAMCLPINASAGLVGSVWSESGAGDQLSTAETVFDSTIQTLDRIYGSLTSSTLIGASSPIYEVDLYKINISDASIFSATTESSNDQDDTALYLFDSLGFGVYMNEDMPDYSSFLSQLPAANVSSPSVNNSIYYLAIALGGFIAQSLSFDDLFAPGAFNDVRPGASVGPLASWEPGFEALTESPFSYNIVLTGATTVLRDVTNAVPEPGSLALLLVGGLAAWQSRRSSRKARSSSVAAA